MGVARLAASSPLGSGTPAYIMRLISAGCQWVWVRLPQSCRPGDAGSGVSPKFCRRHLAATGGAALHRRRAPSTMRHSLRVAAPADFALEYPIGDRRGVGLGIPRFHGRSSQCLLAAVLLAHSAPQRGHAVGMGVVGASAAPCAAIAACQAARRSACTAGPWTLLPVSPWTKHGEPTHACAARGFGDSRLVRQPRWWPRIPA